MGSRTNEWLNKFFSMIMLLQKNDGFKKEVIETEILMRSFDLFYLRLANTNFENKIFIRDVEM